MQQMQQMQLMQQMQQMQHHQMQMQQQMQQRERFDDTVVITRVKQTHCCTRSATFDFTQSGSAHHAEDTLYACCFSPKFTSSDPARDLGMSVSCCPGSCGCPYATITVGALYRH
jgi:hypothetical protein